MVHEHHLTYDTSCSRRIAYFKIEQQLHARNIPFQSIASSSSASPSTVNDAASPPSVGDGSTPTSNLLSKTSPYLAIKSVDVLKSQVDVAYPNVAIQCALADETIRVSLISSRIRMHWLILCTSNQTTFHVRFRDLALAKPDPSEVPSSMTWDYKTSIVVFSSDDVDNCVTTFLK